MVLQQAASDPQNFYHCAGLCECSGPREAAGRLWDSECCIDEFISMTNSIFCPPILDTGPKGERFVNSR